MKSKKIRFLMLGMFFWSQNGFAQVDPSSNCSFLVQELQQNIDRYAKSLERGEWNQSNERLEDIHRRMAGLEPGAPCFSELSSGYLSASAHLYPGGLGALVVTLIQEKIITPLTRSRRNHLGGMWKDQDADTKKYRIFGAYECDPTRISADLTLSPYDLGSVLAHEVLHLIRDKLDVFNPQASMSLRENDPAYALPFRTEKEIQFSISEERFWDELLSTLYSAFIQIKKVGMLPEKSSLVERISGFFKGGYRVLNPPSDADFSLFKTRGNLVDLWQLRFLTDEPYRKGGFSADWDDNTPFSEFFSLFGRIYTPRLPNMSIHNRPLEDFKEAFNEILRNTSKAYFAGSEDEALKLELKLIEMKDHWSFDGGAATTLSLVDPLIFFDAIHKNTPSLYRHLQATLQIRLHQKSVSCGRMEQQTLELQHYLGSRLGGGRPGAEGSRPGADGSRPSALILPCLHLPDAQP